MVCKQEMYIAGLPTIPVYKIPSFTLGATRRDKLLTRPLTSLTNTHPNYNAIHYGALLMHRVGRQSCGLITSL